MPISRRALLVTAGLVGVAGSVLALNDGLRDWLVAELADNFGADVARTPDAVDFIDDFIADRFSSERPNAHLERAFFEVKNRLSLSKSAWREDVLRDDMIRAFVASTSIVLYREDMADFVYSGLADPYERPCSGQLTAYALEMLKTS